MATQNSRLILHAPNVHIGGGFELLRSLLEAGTQIFVYAQLDQRVRSQISWPSTAPVNWVRWTIWARLGAEWRLRRRCCEADTVLCFHGLPPLFAVRGRVVVFVQNRILFESEKLKGYPCLTRLRLSCERMWVRVRGASGCRYVVQTPSMEAAVRRCLGPAAKITVQAFAGPMGPLPQRPSPTGPSIDFVYVASGDAHKNHLCLLEAWRLLSEAALRPSLVLTVNSKSYGPLADMIAQYTERYALNIVNIGQVDRARIQSLYQSSSALIFPSVLESFGLPLIEATQVGLPILAPELDYVRDVVEPVQTFDPASPFSIARAVKRFLGNPEPVVHVGTAEEFLTEVCR